MTQNDPYLHPGRRFPWPGLLAPAIFAILTCLMFDDALFDASKVLANKNTDLAPYFLPARKFGFDELRHGNLALWNPHNYGGAPFLAGFQSALLYPPNWLHLVMPPGLAMNWITALHVFGAGMFMYLWCRHRQLTRGASILAGTMFMFSGPFLPHIYAGHPPHVALIPWAPLIFLSIDLVMEAKFARGTLLGIAALSMFLLAGHPQYVYYTAMAVGVYVAINLWRAKNIGLAVAGGAMIAIGALGMTAAQVFTGIDFVSESVRSGGTAYDFSATFSFPPENVLTAISPNVFGTLPDRDDQAPPEAYFGRCYIWEVCLFVSVTGLVLAVYGTIATSMSQRRGALAMVIVCYILALGAHTPLHRFLYDHLPGFGGFRGSVKFNYLVAMFIALLAGFGFDGLLRARKAPWIFLSVAGGSLIIVLSIAWTISSSAQAGMGGLWHHCLRNALESATNAGELFISPMYLADPRFIQRSGEIAGSAIFGGGVVISIVMVITLIAWWKPNFAYALIALVMIEMIFYAASTRATMAGRKPTKDESAWLAYDMEPPPGLRDAQKSLPPDGRLFVPQNASLGMWFGYDDMWGYDPAVLKRYAELMTVSQGGNADDVSQYVTFRRPDPKVFPLARLDAIVQPDAKQPVIKMPTPMPLAQLVPTAIVLPGRNQIFAAMKSREFDPQHTVLLESEPAIKPTGSSDPGRVSIVKQSTDWIELQIDASASTILLITNAYSKGWRVESLEPGPQAKYEIMPADWAFQAVPLLAGKHHLRLEYQPTAFVVGKWISILTLLGYLVALVWYVRSKRRA